LQKSSVKKVQRPPQRQLKQPGMEYLMKPRPEYDNINYTASGKLKGKTAVITGGDSGIGRAVAQLFAKEGCDIAVIYYNEHKDAAETKKLIENQGRECLLISGDISKESVCKKAVNKIIKKFRKADILINNAGVQYPRGNLAELTSGQLLKTFSTNVFSMFYMTKAVLKYMKEKSSVINTASVTAYRGSGHLTDYAASKGAVISFTRALSAMLAPQKIRVNAVAPGPIWTPLIPASFPPKDVATFGTDVPMGRAGQPYEAAPCYVFLASDDSSYMTGQVLHPNGGEIING
jgi:NAD(P)-dependent dehydrogenase (short-subunit alcohol dehydrogenase family)